MPTRFRLDFFNFFSIPEKFNKTHPDRARGGLILSSLVEIFVELLCVFCQTRLLLIVILLIFLFTIYHKIYAYK